MSIADNLFILFPVAAATAAAFPISKERTNQTKQPTNQPLCSALLCSAEKTRQSFAHDPIPPVAAASPYYPPIHQFIHRLVHPSYKTQPEASTLPHHGPRLITIATTVTVTTGPPRPRKSQCPPTPGSPAQRSPEPPLLPPLPPRPRPPAAVGRNMHAPFLPVRLLRPARLCCLAVPVRVESERGGIVVGCCCGGCGCGGCGGRIGSGIESGSGEWTAIYMGTV